MTRTGPLDSRRLATAVDRLDAVSATEREIAARDVFNVCVYHVTRVRKTHPGPHHRGHGRPITTNPSPPTPLLVFDIIHPHIYRIARRLDRAMRFAEASPHPADAAALICAVDAQGALAALFAVAQNAGVNSNELETLAMPLRKRSAPALLRTLFSPDMRVAKAARKALGQIEVVACCQITPWMTTIKAALALWKGPRINRSILLRNLLARLADILQLVVKQVAVNKINDTNDLQRKKSSRSSLGQLLSRSRSSLSVDKRAQERINIREKLFFKELFVKRTPRDPSISSKLTATSDLTDRSSRRRYRSDGLTNRRRGLTEGVDDLQSAGSQGAFSNTGSYPGSAFSLITDSAAGSANPAQKKPKPTIKRDAATAMYIFERLLSKRTNSELEDRVEVISTLADIASVAFSGHYANMHKIDQVKEYSETMGEIFSRHGQNIYSVVLEILFRPVREVDANKIGVFSFHEAGINKTETETTLTRRRLTDFPQNAICLPNMDCTGSAAVSCNSLLKVLLRFVPHVCSQRMALLTGTINSAFLHSSEALQRTQEGCSWEVSKIVSAVDALTVLVAVIPCSVEEALRLIIPDPVTLRLVVETCVRSVSATGRLLAQNAARASAAKLSDEGTLDSLRSWQALIKIVPGSASWNGTPSYSSSVLFLAQVARRAALISVLQGYRKEKVSGRNAEEGFGDDMYPSVSTVNSSVSGGSESIDDSNGSAPSSLTGNMVGFEVDDENLLTVELHQCIIAMINVPGTNPGEVFFELYRTVVYLYAHDLKKHHHRSKRKDAPEMATNVGATVVEEAKPVQQEDDGQVSGQLATLSKDSRSQSDEDAKGVLVENIAVDGQFPSRALRRAVMASEIDLGEYFDVGQPLSLQHLGSAITGHPPGMHTFEEFAQALAIILGILSNKSITEHFDDPHEAAAMIARDVQRSGSSYLKRVHRRAKAIMRRDLMNQDYDWRTVRYEERIRKLEEQVASLQTLVQQSVEESLHIPKKSFPKLFGILGDSSGKREAGRRSRLEVCRRSKCFCVS